MVEIALAALAVLVLTLSIGVPLPMCFGAALMVMSLVGGMTMKGTMLWGYGQLANPVLLAIPLFILAGTLMSVSGMGKRPSLASRLAAIRPSVPAGTKATAKKVPTSGKAASREITIMNIKNSPAMASGCLKNTRSPSRTQSQPWPAFT